MVSVLYATPTAIQSFRQDVCLMDVPLVQLLLTHVFQNLAAFFATSQGQSISYQGRLVYLQH